MHTVPNSLFRNLIAWLLLPLLVSAGAAQPKPGKPAGPASKAPDDLESLLKGDGPAGTLFRLVDAADPKQPLEPRLFWRRIPAFASVSTTPVRVSVGGDDVIAPKQITGEGQVELNFTYPIEGRHKLAPGRHVLSPGDIPLVLDAGRIKSDHPAVQIAGDAVQIRCAPVRFDGVNSAGAPVPVRVDVMFGKSSLLRERVAFSPLVLWLPVGVRYRSSLGDFTLSAQGKLESVAAEPGVTASADGLRLLVQPPAATAGAAPATGRLWAVSHRGRAVFTPDEEQVFTVLAPRGFGGGAAKVMLAIGRKEASQPVQIGALTLPAVAEGDYDSRAFAVRMTNLPVGEHQLWVESAGGASDKLPVAIVPWEHRSSFFTHTTSHCTGQWPADDAGLRMLSDAGVQMVASSGFHSVLDTAMPVLAPASSGPAGTGLKRAENDLLLERLLRHGLRSADLAPMRGQVFYLESLSYHHSYGPTVERMIRKMQIYTQQTAEYPSAWGVNYSWFPQLFGYSEGGVPTDAHVGDRNRVLGENLLKAGFTPLTKEEREFHKASKFSSDPAARAKALDIQRRAITYWKAQQDFGWGRHNKLYNDAVREVRPDTACLLLENAGHDALKRTRSIFGDMNASFYGTYTDFGDWPVSAGFTTDWARGNFPGQPVWLTTSWGTTPEGMAKSLLHAFSRGVAGGGVPMQEEAGPVQLARRAKTLAFVTQFGAIATRAVPDNRFAILSTASQQVMVGGNIQYVYHALYYHLTHLGCPPVIVDDVVAVEKGVPAAVKVLFLARQEQPLEPELSDAIAAFQKRGGQVILTGDCLVEVPGAVRLAPPVKQLWDIGGFTAESHAAIQKEFEDNWCAPLAAALAKTGVPPLATTNPDLALVNCLDAGPVCYAVVIADVKGKHSNIFEPVNALPVSIEGTGWIVRDLVKQETLRTETKNGRTEVLVDLVSEPVSVLACYPSAPATLTARGGAADPSTFSIAGDVQAADKSDMGAVPVRIQLLDPSGRIHSTLFRAAGEEARFHIGALAESGPWKFTIQEQLTGLTLAGEWKAPGAGSAAACVTPLPEVHVVNEAHVSSFVRRSGEKLVIIEPGQEAMIPVAKRLIERLNAAGQQARLWQMSPGDYDTIPLRWYPQEEDQARLKQVSTGQLVGWRGQMKPFIDKVLGTHVPKRGGYSEDAPSFMVGEDCIVFPGGLLAESLRAVTPWMNTPNAPGRGQGRLVVCFSPFAGGKQVTAVVGNDLAGIGKAADQLAATAASVRATSAAAPSVPKAQSQIIPGVVSPDSVAVPLRNFTPVQRVVKLLANPRGSAAVILAGNADTLAMVDEKGSITGSVAAEIGDVRQARIDDLGRVWTLVPRATSHDKAWHFANAHEFTLRSIAPDGAIQGEVVAFTGETYDLPPDHTGGVRLAPDGATFAFGRRAGLLLGKLDPSAPAVPAYDDLPFARMRFEVRNPRFPIGATYSPDSQFVCFTMDTRPRFGGMGVPMTKPTACEAILVDAQSGKRLWGLRAGEPKRPVFSGPASADIREQLRRQESEHQKSTFAALTGFAAISRNGDLTAIADYEGTIFLVDKAGAIVLRESVATPVKMDQPRLGPPGGVGVWISDNGNVAAFAFETALHIARGGKVIRVAPAVSVVSAGVSADGSLVFAACEDGEVIAFGPDGAKKWSYQCGGPKPQIATVRADELLVATNSGELILLDSVGKETRRVNVAAAADRQKHAPQPAADFQRFAPPVETHDPGTLALAQSRLGAKQIAAWKPAGKGTPACGREFFAVTSPIDIAAGNAVGECFIHLVYRRPGANKETTITTSGPDGTEKFILDLPTPQFRVVDIPARGPGAKFTVSSDGPLEVAECSVWNFAWPGANKVYVAPAAGGSDPLAVASPKPAKGGGDLNLDDLIENGGASGKPKDARIYISNPDPDQVKGRYLKPSAEPITALDGRRFGNGTLRDWTSGLTKQYKGALLTVDMGKPAPVRFVATYDRASKQSGVTATFSVFSGFDSEYSDESGDLLAAAVENDQFWRIFPVNSPRTTVLGVHVFNRQASPEGLSEVEAY